MHTFFNFLLLTCVRIYLKVGRKFQSTVQFVRAEIQKECSISAVMHRLHHLTAEEKIIRFIGFVVIGMYLCFVLVPFLRTLWLFSFPIGIILYWILPLSLGYFASHIIVSRIWNRRRPLWVVLPLYWVGGVLLFNIAALFTHIFQIHFTFTSIALYLFFLGVYSLFGNEKQIRGTDIIPLLKQHRKDVLWILCGSLLTIVFYMWWAMRIDFVSFNTDNLQNMHLANVLKNQKVFNLFAVSLSPQYTQIDYTTVFTPIAALLTDIIPYQSILSFMSYMEIATVTGVFITRYCLMRHFSLRSIDAMLVACISVWVTFSGLYMPGTIYNQQVHVFILPTILYYFYNKENVAGFLTMLFVLPFHFTMSVFLWWTSLTLWFFRSVYPLWQKKMLRGFLRIDKIVFILLLCVVLVLEGVYTFETNYEITRFFLAVLSERPQLLNSVGIYSNIAVLQIMFQGMGPLLTGLLIVMPIAWIVSHRLLERWVFLLMSTQLLILSIPFPVAARTFVFFSIPFSLGVYVLLQRLCFKNPILVRGMLILSVCTMLLWSVTVRSNDMDISGRYWNRPFLSKAYQESLIKGAQVLESRSISYSQYKVVSEYFVKQHFEVMAEKYDDNGVYEENKVERGLMYDYLNGYKNSACSYYGREYVVYIINERTYKWSKTPRSLATLSSFSIWWSQPPTLIEQDYVTHYTVNTTGTIIYDQIFDGFNRFIIVDCTQKRI